jgi:hypothetical protein
MLLPISTDTLMPPSESTRLARAFTTVRKRQKAGGDSNSSPESLWRGDAGLGVHCEVMESENGHDAFLIPSLVSNTGCARWAGSVAAQGKAASKKPSGAIVV